MTNKMPEDPILPSEALQSARRAEHALATRVAARFLANRSELVAAASEKSPASVVPFRFRPALAAAAVLAMGVGIGLALWNQNGSTPATYVANRAIITDSGA